MKNLGLTLLSFTAISISQAPVIADILPLNLPMCHMITSRGIVLNLNYMCGGVKTTDGQNTYSQTSRITATDVCRSYLSDMNTAITQFQYDRAKERWSYCLQNKDTIQKSIDSRNP